jgi:nitrate reductase NapAB chaperone NapD
VHKPGFNASSSQTSGGPKRGGRPVAATEFLLHIWIIMAVTGFLLHTLPEDGGRVEAAAAAFPEITTYGVHQGCYVVAVAEAPGIDMEALLRSVQGIDGVLAAYVTSMTVEDELEP